MRYYAEARLAGEGTPEYDLAEDVARAFNRRILAYNREYKRRYPGGRAEQLAEEQLAEQRLANTIKTSDAIPQWSKYNL